MIKRLRLKFIAITMTILTVMMTILLFSQMKFTSNSLMDINMRALKDAAHHYRQALPEMEMMPDPPGQMTGNPVKPEGEHPCFILKPESDGTLTAEGSGYYDLSDWVALREIYRAVSAKEKPGGVLWEYELQYLRAGTAEDPIYVFTDFSSELETMHEMGRYTMLIWFLSLICFFFLTIFLANWAVRPVERAWEQQRQFVADASHELKTPLTVILTNAELLREKAENTDQLRFSDSIITMTGQMRGLVENMLQLARADSGQTAGEREKLDWSAQVEQMLLLFEPLFFEAGLTLKSTVCPGVSVTGNAAQLKRVVEILLDNALKYAAPGGSVDVTLESRGCHCSLRVASTGQPLTPQQCRDIFKRFYRVDPARRRDGSYGLGLAIAERVVSDHRGKIWAEGRDGVNTFYVNLPVN